MSAPTWTDAWRVSDMAFSDIGFYTVTGGHSCHWATYWMPISPSPKEAQRG